MAVHAVPPRSTRGQRDDASGEVVVLPLHPGVETDVRGHAFLAASRNVGYDFTRIEKLASSRWRPIIKEREPLYP
jgi:uncharacterized protein (AIM24 family)